MKIPKVPAELAAAIKEGHRFLLTSHINPDGDAIGSEMALSRVLEKLGKQATIWNRDPTPRIYQSLPGSHRIHVGEDPPHGFPETFAAAIVLECPHPDRTGLASSLEKIKVLNIDHHLGNTHYGDINWVDTAAPAVGELVFRMAQDSDVELDPNIANALYMTLVTDTGGFRFSNTTPEAFETAAELVRRGASPETVSHWLYESQPVAVLRLLGEVLGSLELHDGGKVATVWITREMMKKAGAQSGDSEGLIDYPRSISGVQAVALFRDLGNGQLKVSLRSRGKVDVEKIAREMGGGGHRNAAGFTYEDGSGGNEPIAVRISEALSRAIAEMSEESGDQPVKKDEG